MLLQRCDSVFLASFVKYLIKLAKDIGKVLFDMKLLIDLMHHLENVFVASICTRRDSIICKTKLLT